MTTTKATVDLKTLEFMLDLPHSFEIKDVVVNGETATLTLETDEDMPEAVSLVYQTDEYGNVALTGFGDTSD